MAPPKGKDDKKKGPQGPIIKDARFAHVHRDPRFMRPTKKDSKVTVDSRFSSMLKGTEFSSAPKVDKYGRKLQGKAGDQQMKKFYQLQRGQTGSDEDEDEDQEAVSGSDDEGDFSGSEDEDEGVFDPMRGRGVISGSDSDESESDIDEEAAAELDAEAEVGEEEEEESEDDVPRGDESHRFACVNLDWDHVKSTDLFKVFSGFKLEKGAIRSVKVYPSEFGKERLEREEREGPPVEIFKKPGSNIKLDEDASDDDDDEEVTQETLIKEQAEEGDEHVDQEALRQYQLDRLKYYYAVVDCDSVETAKAICEACDGAEYESSANFFDLRYIPDGMEFDDKPRDEAFGAPENYRPSEFSTKVFQHSNVKLTWDEDDADRIKVTRHKFSKEDLEDMDFKAYLASSDEDGSEDEDDIEATRRKYRALLAGGNKDSDDSDADSDDDKNQEMEITFAPGLSEKATELLEEKKKREEPVKEETSIDAYRRKEKERKQRRKDARAAKIKGSESEGDSDDEEQGGDALFSEDEDERLMNDSYFAEEFAGGDMMSPTKGGKKGAAAGADKKKKNKSDKKKRTKEERLEDNRKKAELELLMEDNRESNQHFNMKEIQRAEKNEKKIKKMNKKNPNNKDKGEDLQDDFKIDVQDPRFSALHESHHFALDPTNPNFKKTKAMTELMQERQKRTAGQGEEILEQTPDQKQKISKNKNQNKNNNNKNTNKNTNNNNNNSKNSGGGVKKATGLFEDPSLSLLVDTVKRKSAMATESSRDGKRSKKN